MGLIIGLGIWSDELILTLVVAALGVLMLARPREIFGLAGLIMLFGVVIGGFPFIAYNVAHGGLTFIELSHQQLSGSGTGLTAVISRANLMANQFLAILATEMPAVLGSPHICVVPGSLYASYASYPAQAVTIGGAKVCAGANSVFSLLLLAAYVFALWQAAAVLTGIPSPAEWLSRMSGRTILKKRHPGNTRHRSLQTGPDSAKSWLRALLVVVAGATLTEFMLTNHSVVADRFVSARYLLPLYITLPILFGTLWEWAAPLISSLHQGGIRILRDPSVRPWWALAATHALVVMLAFSVIGATETVVTAADTSRFAFDASPVDQRLIQKLSALGITRFYTDYWDCYDIAFESGEHLRCSLYQQVDRYPPYAALLRATTYPAYVLPLGQEHEFDLTEAPILFVAGYIRVASDGYAIYYLPGDRAR